MESIRLKFDNVGNFKEVYKFLLLNCENKTRIAYKGDDLYIIIRPL